MEIDDEQRYRASAYSLLAALLRCPPEQALLDHVGQLSPVGDGEHDELSRAMSTLALAAQTHQQAELTDEYHSLFIGLGKGEVVPYASWYLTGFMMEQPLSDLRDDLRALGFERSSDTREPEDHAAALCEVISVMINEATSLAQQKQFFESHMQKWLGRFLVDLANADSAQFYQSVACFGAAFIELEQDYMSMQS
jgi:TorA maturation chaperone TorD